MAVELITGYAGTAHVGSDDARSAIAGIVGTGSYYSSYKTPVVSMTNANTLHITECWLYLGGGFFHVEDADATIGNGEGVLKRCDLLCVEYDKNSSTSVESAKLVVVKGTAGSTATVPTVTSGDLIAGCSVAQFPIAKVTLDGLTPTAALMVGKAPTTAALQDSASKLNGAQFYTQLSQLGLSNGTTMLAVVAAMASYSKYYDYCGSGSVITDAPITQYNLSIEKGNGSALVTCTSPWNGQTFKRSWNNGSWLSGWYSFTGTAV